jgi:hypothetical protein
MRALLVQIGQGREGWDERAVAAWTAEWPETTPAQRFLDCGVYAAVWGRRAVLSHKWPTDVPVQVWRTPRARRAKQKWLYDMLVKAEAEGNLRRSPSGAGGGRS